MQMLFFLLLSGLTAWADTLPASLSPTLARAGGNRSEVVKAWEKCPETQRAGMEYLLQHMPTRDARRLRANFLLENVRLAYQARGEMPWGQNIPEDIFFNDVLPYACLDESRDSWRAPFYQTFAPIVAPARNATEALSLLQQSITPTLGVRYNTQRRAPNQGPHESIQRKMASCTGLAILLADAARAVCIPARIVGIAQWTTKDGNHNWNEIWLPERKAWVATEYDRDDKGLDHGWFLADAARAVPNSLLHGVYASSWKKTERHFPMVWNMDDRSVPAIDVTPRYLELGKQLITPPGQCELRIDVTEREPHGHPRRIVRTVEVRQGDTLIARGKSPSVTEDRNRFLSIKVPQGVRYQILLFDTRKSSSPAHFVVAPTQGQEHMRVAIDASESGIHFETEAAPR